MAAGRNVGLRKPGLRRAFDPADGGGGDGGETRIGDTVTDPRLKVVDHDDMGLFYDDALGIGTASGDGHRTHAIKFGEQDHGEDEGGGEGGFPIGTVAAYGENVEGNPFTQLRLKAGAEAFAELSLFMESAPDFEPEAALISSERLRIAAYKIALDVDYAAGQYLLSNGEMVVTQKIPVVVASTGPGDLALDFAAGNFVDGWGLSVGERILIKDQADDTENGIYIVTAGAPTRADDGRTLEWAHVVALRGTTQARQTFVNINPYIGGFGPGNPINFVTLREFIGAQRANAALDLVAAAVGPTGLALLGAIDGPAAGYVIDPKVQAFALLAEAADKIAYFDGVGSMALTDFPAVARAFLAATTEAGQRAALGLLDLTDEASAELAHAKSVCAFANPTKLWFADALAKLGTFGSKWTTLLGGTGNVSIVQTGERGGVNEITTGATASSYVQLISCINGLASYGGAMMNDLTAADSKWHVQFDFKLTAAVDNVTELGFGWISPGGAPGPVVGVRGAQSTGFYRLYVSGSSTGVNSTVAIDTNVWHRARMWGNGDGKIYASIDGETPIQLTGYSYGTEAAPYGNFLNNGTAAARKWRTAGIYYRVDGNLAA